MSKYLPREPGNCEHIWARLADLAVGIRTDAPYRADVNPWDNARRLLGFQWHTARELSRIMNRKIETIRRYLWNGRNGRPAKAQFEIRQLGPLREYRLRPLEGK